MNAMTMTMILAGLMATFGFVALLCSKIYVNAGTKETEVEMPLLGKIKTNYPALVFVAIGAVLAVYAIRECSDDLERWTVSGVLQLPQDAHKKIDWRDGCIKLLPGIMGGEIRRDGSYDLYIDVKPGVDLKKAIQKIDYSNGPVSVKIDLSNPDKVEGKSLTYKPMTVTWW